MGNTGGKGVLLVLGAGAEQVPLIRAAQVRGLRVIAADAASDAAGSRVADDFLHVDIHDDEAIARGVPVQPEGVVAHAVEAAESAARLAQRFSVVGNPPEVATVATDKVLRWQRLAEAGVPTPRAMACPIDDYQKRSSEFGFPHVAKPNRGAGARGVLQVRSAAEVGQAVGEFQRLGATAVLIEELLAGPELSTEAFIHEGTIHTFAVADRNYARRDEFLPHIIEDGVDFPSRLEPEMLARAVRAAEMAARALGLRTGSAKGDILVGPDGPVVIEMAARSSGGWFGFGSIPIATGIRPFEVLIALAMGEEPDWTALEPSHRTHCAQRYVIPTESGWFAGLDGLGRARSMSGVRALSTMTPRSGTWIERATNHGDRLAQVICTGVDREDAARNAEAAVAEISIILSDGGGLRAD